MGRAFCRADDTILLIDAKRVSRYPDPLVVIPGEHRAICAMFGKGTQESTPLSYSQTWVPFPRTAHAVLAGDDNYFESLKPCAGAGGSGSFREKRKPSDVGSQ